MVEQLPCFAEETPNSEQHIIFHDKARALRKEKNKNMFESLDTSILVQKDKEMIPGSGKQNAIILA